ncbi:hypothetical protein M9H77_24067 [Catharanthus roseus]|uniref:Uncharacterized protein n=1 Tax=Catharanthus roseus TaxID=4058 RepID=A0ACC0AW10_CATRO|nr:hypothetical protein M9H77_24067 [Catharanthus roseus]
MARMVFALCCKFNEPNLPVLDAYPVLVFAKLILDLLGLAPLVGERLALLSASPSLVRELVRASFAGSSMVALLEEGLVAAAVGGWCHCEDVDTLGRGGFAWGLELKIGVLAGWFHPRGFF